MTFSRVEISANGTTSKTLRRHIDSAWFATTSSSRVRFTRFNLAICGSNIMVRREAALAVGGFDEQFAPADDWDFVLKICDRFFVTFCDRPHVIYMRRKGCITENQTELLARQSDRVREKWLNRFSGSELSDYDRLQGWCEDICEYLFRRHPERIVSDPYGIQHEEFVRGMVSDVLQSPEYQRDVQAWLDENEPVFSGRLDEYLNYLNQKGEQLKYWYRLFRGNREE